MRHIAPGHAIIGTWSHKQQGDNTGMFGEVRLPDDVSGRLFIYKMPGHVGYGQSFKEDSAMIEREQMDLVVCLAPFDEIKRKSPEYALAIAANALRWKRREYPIEDFTAPEGEERQAFLAVVQDIARELREGRRVLVHCAAGKGRSGLVATAILIALGLSREEAMRRVREAGGRPETESQLELIDWVAVSV